MKNIQLGGHKNGSEIRGYVTVDDDDFEKLNKYKWHILVGKWGGSYTCRHEIRNVKRERNEKGRFIKSDKPNIRRNGKYIFMHREIVSAQKGEYVDHIDGNGLNNTKSNLRLCTNSQNGMNRGKPKNNTSGYKGVVFFKQTQRWMAHIKVNQKSIHLGYFQTPELAFEAYCNAVGKYHGSFSNTGS